MEQLLNIVHNQLAVSPYALTIESFKAIWQRDTTERKDKAIKELSFIFFMEDYHSPYAGYMPEDRIVKVSLDLGLEKNFKPDAVLIKALEEYREFEITSSASLSLLRDVEEGIFKIREFIRSVNIKADEKGSKMTSLLKSMSSVGDLSKTIAVLRSQVEKEMQIGQVGRAGRQISARELPPDRRKK